MDVTYLDTQMLRNRVKREPSLLALDGGNSLAEEELMAPSDLLKSRS